MGQVSVSPGVICEEKFRNFIPLENEVYCPWVWDKVLCWPPTRAGVTYSQPCPKGIRIDHTKLVSRECSLEGKWGGRMGEDSGVQGWTNYTTCFSTELTQLMRKLHSGDHSQAQRKLDIAEKTRILELVGLSLSLAALIISLAIFCRFRILRNNRTRIHKNLFIAMVIQVVTRLTLYIDQAIIRKPSIHQFQQGIDNTSILCEGAYVLLEYARTAMFMWMFIEGLYLHNVVTVRVLQENTHYRVYTGVGWGAPVLMTAAWAGVTAVHIKTDCWAGYNLNASYWILEGPRMAVIILNFLFLLNIIRVLIVKLRQSRTSELEQARKAVRAALVLLPLLGITNLINMTEAPLERPVWEFAAWSYTTHFLTSFQGVFIAFLYCFLNGEVRTAVSKSVSTYLWMQRYNQPVAQRNSAYITVSGRPSLPQAPSEPVLTIPSSSGILMNTDDDSIVETGLTRV